MDPELFASIIDVLVDSVVADGMDTDLGSLSFTFDAKGGVSIKSTSAAGVDYSNDATAEDIAAALDLEPVEEPGVEAEAAPEKEAA